MGEFTGISSMVWALAQPIGATALGAMGDYIGSLRAVMWGAGIALLVSFVILQTVRMPTGQAAAAGIAAEPDSGGAVPA